MLPLWSYYEGKKARLSAETRVRWSEYQEGTAHGHGSAGDRQSMGNCQQSLLHRTLDIRRSKSLRDCQDQDKLEDCPGTNWSHKGRLELTHSKL